MPRSTPAISSSVLGPRVARMRQRHVGHALNGHVHRRVGERAAVGAVEAHGGGDGAVELVADQRPLAHQVERLSLHALVVDADRRQPVLHRAVARHVHDGGAVGERAELVEGGEGGPGVGRLVPHGPVQLGGVPDRLVDGEPEVRRVDHEVVRPGLHRRRRQLLGQELGQLGELGVPVPAARRRRTRSGTPSRGRPVAPACASSRSRRPTAPAPPAASACAHGAAWRASR